MDKNKLSERDIFTKFKKPDILVVGWQRNQFREEVKFINGLVMIQGKLASRVTNPELKGLVANAKQYHNQLSPTLLIVSEDS